MIERGRICRGATARFREALHAAAVSISRAANADRGGRYDLNDAETVVGPDEVGWRALGIIGGFWDNGRYSRAYARRTMLVRRVSAAEGVAVAEKAYMSVAVASVVVNILVLSVVTTVAVASMVMKVLVLSVVVTVAVASVVVKMLVLSIVVSTAVASVVRKILVLSVVVTTTVASVVV